MILAALRRFGLLVLLCIGVTAGVSSLLGLLLGASIDRSLTLGFYLMGCFLLVTGFFVGNRGPARIKSELPGPSVLPFPMFGGARQLRWATPSEQYETMTSSAVFISVGLILILVGTLVDSRHSFF
jgi:hypothetical protein